MKNYTIFFLLCSIVFAGCSTTEEKEISDFRIDNNPEKWLEIARQNRAHGELNLAATQYEAILAKNPQNQEAIEGLAQTQTSLYQYQNALDNWNKLLLLDPENKEAKIAKARLLVRFGEFEEATTLLGQAAEKDPNDWRIWDGLGIIHDLQGDYPKASFYYHLALEKNNTRPEIYNNLGYSQMMSQSYTQAIDTLEQGLKYNPKSTHIKNNLVLAYAWVGNYKEAITLSNLINGEAESYNNVGYIALMRKDYDIAEEYFQKAIDISPSFYRKAFQNLEKLRNQRLEELKIKEKPLKTSP